MKKVLFYAISFVAGLAFTACDDDTVSVGSDVLPDMDKSELFPTVIKDGALPRKTFSMGHAADKRFYMECRRITT